ncbi:DUF2278 family protein [Streptomyces sp. NPDC029004]|uniref:DUF2278 family protein n=1 Tax=Streptomyces sp. NPDC029004 TaxID=3154490 RepID=UPI00340BB5CB
MPLNNYGVLAARAVAGHREEADNTPHYQIHLRDNGGIDYRASVNVRSQLAPSELLYRVDDDFRHPLTRLLPQTGSGWTMLPSLPTAANLDYIRGNLLHHADMRTLPPNLPGVDNDLADLLDHYVERAISDQTIGVFVFGERWGPEPHADKVFHFTPGNGVHDVHMNQGNTGRFITQDGVWQDGGLLFHLPQESRWVGLFLAFQSQAWHTDDTTGHTIPLPPSIDHAVPLRITAALVNPVGPAPETETVTLLNTSDTPIDLTGWHLADKNKNRLPLPAQQLPPGATLTVTSSDGFALGNRGGAITLLNPDGLKIHGVAYTAQQAREGITIAF